MASEPRDLGALEKAVNEAASRAGGLWISFVSFATLVVITTGTVTHKQLLLESPLKLPVLNVELPLIGYFVAVPIFFVIFHFYVLLQLDGLAARVRAYNAALRREHPLAADQDLLRYRLDPFIFTQMLAGARARREGRIGLLLRSVGWITMVGLPLVTLLLVQLIFLPYHDENVTWWHRGWVLVDLVLVWFFWQHISSAREKIATSPLPAVRRLGRIGAGTLKGLQTIQVPQSWRNRLAAWGAGRLPRRAALRTGPAFALKGAGVALTGGMAVIAALVAAYPEEKWYWPKKLRTPFEGVTRTLFEGDVNVVTGAPNSWLGSNRLVLPNADFGVEEKLAGFAKTQNALDEVSAKKASAKASNADRKITLSLRGRDLSRAVFERVDMRQADFTAVDMPGADLYEAKLDRTIFECDLTRLLADLGEREKHLKCANLQGARLGLAQLQGASLEGARLQRASLIGARLQGAFLDQANLENASLDGAHLQGASLNRVHLEGVSLVGAQLQGASLNRVHLEGVSLESVSLQGVSLDEARLEGASLGLLHGASLEGAHLEGASLDRAHLQGTLLKGAHLQGASLDGAHLQGASLDGAHLQGASLVNAQLAGASLRAVNIFRTWCPTSPLPFATTRCLHPAWASTADVRGVHLIALPVTARGVTRLRKLLDEIVARVPETRRQEVQRRLSTLDLSVGTSTQDAQLARRWARERTRSLSPPRRAAILERLACSAGQNQRLRGFVEYAPYVARGLMWNGRLAATRHRLHDIAERMRKGKSDPSACPGVKGFTDADWKRLDDLVAKAPPKPTAIPSTAPK
jgi:uncharacterized protein YjbI with pentapeptide repeats